MKTGNGGIYHIPQDLKRPEKALGNGLSGLFQSTEVSNSEFYHKPVFFSLPLVRESLTVFVRFIDCKGSMLLFSLR